MNALTWPLGNWKGCPNRWVFFPVKHPPDLIQITENGLKFWVDIKEGQKTGFYLDQRINRQQLCLNYQGQVPV